MRGPIQHHRRRYVSTTLHITETPRFRPVSPSRRGQDGVTRPTRGEFPMARFPAFPRRSRLAAVTALAVLIGGAAYGAATSAAASKTTRATTIRVVDYYAFEPDKSGVGGVLNSCGKGVGVNISPDALPGATLIQKGLQM